MTRYLLAAEADKIQDFLFRSARLREVVGGSQLLTRFCQEAAEALMRKHQLPLTDIVTSDGGGFRILFDDCREAETFGAELAEVYRLAVDGSLTVAEPAPYDGNFQKASKDADEKLRLAKQRRLRHEVPRQLPYIAVCASCGVAAAQAYKPVLHEDQPISEVDNPASYVCYSCRVKRAERQHGGGQFLDAFEKAVQAASGAQEALPWLDEPEDMARFDARRYVAYLVADGNNMGKLFGQCTSPAQMTHLSQRLTQTIRTSLAAPVAEIMRQSQEHDTKGKLPALPLILGGDDVFVLLPAPWAMDVARRFCLNYERAMNDVLRDLCLQPEQPPTMTAAVVICKSSYPYRLAHQRGDALVQEAKRLSKAVALYDGVTRSMVHFAIVVGNRLVDRDEDAKLYRPSLAPYWAQDDGLSAEAWAIPLTRLLEGRYALRHLPARRRASLRTLLHPVALPNAQPQSLDAWNKQLEALLARVGRESGNRVALEQVLVALGQTRAELQGYWRRLRRLSQHHMAHGLLDLLEAWDFAYALDKDRKEYVPKGE